MSRLGRDKLREKRFSRSRQVTGCIGLMRHSDLVKEIGQTCDRSATVRPACRTLNRRMVTAAEPVYSTCSSRQEEYENRKTHRHRSASQPVHLLRAVGERPELFDGLEVGGPAAVYQEAAAERRDRRGGNREHAVIPRRGGAACSAGSGGRSEPVQGD